MRLTRETAWALGFSAVTTLLRLPFVGLPFDPRDEGYYAAVAQATVRGNRLYADMWYVRPPFLNTAYAWSYRFSLGTAVPFDLTLRLFATLFAAATVGVLAWLLFKEFSPRAAFLGSAAAALMGASLALQNEANSETWMMLPYTLSALLLLYVALREPPPRRAAWLVVLAGVLTGVAAAFKQVALVNLALPIVAWLVFDRAHVRRWLGLAAAFVAGTLGVWAAILVRFGVADDLRAFLYYAWFRNVLYMSDSHARMNPLQLLLNNLGGLALAFTISGALALALFGISLARRAGLPRNRLITLYAFGWLCLSAMGVAASGRFYLHYFIQATVPLALLLAASAETLLTAENRRRVAAVTLATMVALGLLPPLLSWVVDLRSAASTSAQRAVYKDLGARLPQLTVRNGRVMVWGICVSVRAYCPLRPATRLAVVCYDYGWSPISRGSLLGENFPSTGDIVLADLRHSAPDTIVLTAPLNPLSASGLGQAADEGSRFVSVLSAEVSKHYQVEERGVGYIVLRRRS